jgi:hypothetical protein
VTRTFGCSIENSASQPPSKVSPDTGEALTRSGPLGSARISLASARTACASSAMLRAWR